MRILISQSYYRVLDPKEASRKMPYPPLGTLILATLLRDQGHQITFHDAMLAEDPSSVISLLNPEFDLFVIYDDEFNYLTKMSLLNMRENTSSVLAAAKENGIPSVVYTSDAIDHPLVYLKNGADVVVTGEGETVIEDLVKSLELGGGYDDVQGIAFLSDGRLIMNGRKQLRKDLDSLPDPDYGYFVDIDKYRSIWLGHHGFFSLNISTSRGCTYGRNWCSKPLWGRTYNAYSPARIVSLLEKIKQDYRADHVWITDDIFGLQKGWLKEFADRMETIDSGITYKCLSRADLLLKGDTISDLARSGCEIIWIGAESGSQRILDAMDKGTKVDQIIKATKEVKEHGMQIAYFLQLGYLGENWDDIELTRKLVRENIPDDIGISVSYPLPGTKFYDMVKDHLGEKQNWTDSDDLDMMFHGTYSREVYRLVHRLVHNEYRMHKSIRNFGLFKMPKLVYHFLQFSYYRMRLRSIAMNETDKVDASTVQLSVV